MFGWRGEGPCHDLQQFRQADAGLGGRGDHRVEGTLGDGRLQVADEDFRRDFLASEVPVHQRLILAFGDDPFDERAPRRLCGGAFDVAGLPGCGQRIISRLGRNSFREQAQQSGDLRPVADRQVERQDRVAEGPLAFPERRVEVRTGVVQPADHHRPRNPDALAFSPQCRGGSIDIVNSRDDEQRRVRRAQPGAQFADEVRVTRRVEQVHLDTANHHGNHGEGDGALLVDRGRLRVAHSGAFGDGTFPRNHTGGGQQRLGQHRLPGARVANQRHIPDQLRLFGRPDIGRVGPPEFGRAPGGGLPRNLGVFRRHGNLLACIRRPAGPPASLQGAVSIWIGHPGRI